MASFLESLKKALKAETYSAMLEEVGEDFDWSVIPYTRFSKVVGERNALKDQVAGLEEAGGNADPNKKFTQADIDAAVSKKTTELQATFDTQLNDLKVRDAALSKLREANAVDAEMIYDSNKFDKTALKFDKNGALEGIDDLIKTFKEQHGGLFGEGDVTRGTGKKGGTDDDKSKALDAQLNAMFGATMGIGSIVEN